MQVAEYPEVRIYAEPTLDRWLATGAKGWRIAVAAACLILAACAAVLTAGVPPEAVYGHDVLISLDGAWRVLHGQRPHVDFYSAFGPVPYLISAAGLAATKFQVGGLAAATAAVGAILGAWIWALARTRLKAWAALLLLTLTLAFWLAPFPLGEPFYLTGYAMQYNRLGYALLFLVLVELFAPSSELEASGRSGISTGAVFALLLFTKISFFFAGCGLLAAAYFLYEKKRRHLAWVALGFALVALPMLAYLHFDVVGMLRDLAMAAAARKTRFVEGYDPLRSIVRNLTAIVSLAGLAVFAHRDSSPEKARRLTGLTAVILAADLLLAMSNTQRSGFPLAIAAAAILASRSRPFSPAIAFATVLCALPTISDTANSFTMVARMKLTKTPAARVNAPHLSKLIFADHNEPGVDSAVHNGALYVDQVNEGLALLRRASLPQERIACLWFANPFSYALLQAPASGGSPFWAYGVNITQASSPTAARILGNADLVIYPKHESGDREVDTLLAVASPMLTSHYRIAAESQHWILWRHQ